MEETKTELRRKENEVASVKWEKEKVEKQLTKLKEKQKKLVDVAGAA
jgi:hypothetical protein